jgi:regulator of sigma E protease
MQFLETAFYFVVTLGVLVFVHELGHFLAAKLFKMRVDRFSIGFPPRAFGKKIGETDYCISWIPIGGFVKISGMIDESFDTEHLDKAPEPWEFRSKPIWQRMIVISAGVTMNILLAVFIFWGVNYTQGKTVRDTTEIEYVIENSPAAKAGIEAGDKVVEIDGTSVTYWGEIFSHMYIESMGGDVTLTILRNSKEVQLFVPRSSIPEPPEPFGIIPAHIEIVIGAVDPGRPADELGLKPMDVILALNGTPVKYTDKVIELVQSSAGKPLLVEWKRGDQIMSGTTTPSDDGLIGIMLGERYAGPQTTLRYSLLEALPEGLKFMINLTGAAVQQIWMIVSGQVAFSKSVGGPIKIAQIASQSAELGFVAYLHFMAFLSITLAVLNILPFPVLDGGHLVFLILEGIFRREIPVKIKLGLQKAGFAILIAFMAVVVYNDIVNF